MLHQDASLQTNSVKMGSSFNYRLPSRRKYYSLHRFVHCFWFTSCIHAGDYWPIFTIGCNIHETLDTHRAWVKLHIMYECPYRHYCQWNGHGEHYYVFTKHHAETITMDVLSIQSNGRLLGSKHAGKL